MCNGSCGGTRVKPSSRRDALGYRASGRIVSLQDGKSDALVITGITVAGVGLAAVCFWPGFLSGDSLWQLEQAQTGRYFGWHSPMMTRLWSLLLLVAPPRGGMFLCQSALLWLGLAILARTIFPGSVLYAAGTGALIGLSPVVLGIQSQLLKDASLAAALVFAFAALLRASTRRAWPWLGCGALALFYALGLRHNSLPAVLPLLVWAAFFRRGGSRVARVGVGLAATVGLWLGALLVNGAIENQPSNYPAHQPLLYDVVAIAARTGHPDYIPRFYTRGEPPLTREDVDALYHPSSAFWLFYPADDGHRRLHHITSKEEFRAIATTWWELVRRHPDVWLAHKRATFLHVMRPTLSRAYYLPGPDDPSLAGGWNRSFRRASVSALDRIQGAFLFQGWPYTLALVVALAAAPWLPLRRRDAWVALALSGLLYESAYLLVAVGEDFRFSWWPACATLMLPFLLAAPERPAPRHEPKPAGERRDESNRGSP